MPQLINFYMDDSGTRKPNRVPLAFDAQQPNFFALGGVLVRDEDEQEIRDAHAALCDRWGISYPLHSVDIRNCTKKFSWVRGDLDTYKRFMADLNRFVTHSRVHCLACVIDRPGYDARYREKYGRNQWHLCQTAFYVAVERAVKFAISQRRKLKVLPEQSNRDDEKRLRSYFRAMQSQGCPFAGGIVAYRPLTAEEFKATLHGLEFKQKTSPMAQLADLVLWPLAVGGYRPDNRPLREFRKRRILLDDVLPDDARAERGIKYSCFGLVHGKSEP